MTIDWYPPSIVRNLTPTIREQSNCDVSAESRHRFVNGVIYYLPHQVVQAGRPGRSDVHPRPCANWLEAGQDSDVG